MLQTSRNKYAGQSNACLASSYSIANLAAKPIDHRFVEEISSKPEVLCIIHPSWRRLSGLSEHDFKDWPQNSANNKSLHNDITQLMLSSKDYKGVMQDLKFIAMMQQAAKLSTPVIIAIPFDTLTSSGEFIQQSKLTALYVDFINSVIKKSNLQQVYCIPTQSESGNLFRASAIPRLDVEDFEINIRMRIKDGLSHKKILLAGGALEVCLSESLDDYLGQLTNINLLIDQSYSCGSEDINESDLKTASGKLKEPVDILNCSLKPSQGGFTRSYREKIIADLLSKFPHLKIEEGSSSL